MTDTQSPAPSSIAAQAPVDGCSTRLRLVREEDAEYIWGLRMDPAYNTHLSTVSGTAEDQRNWIRGYKLREAAGIEYYFVIERLDDGRRCGVVRVYGIADGAFTWGSWILDANKPAKAALDTAMSIYRFAFDRLGLNRAVFDVRRNNERTLAFHDRFGGQRTGADEENIYYEIPVEKFRDLAPKLTAALAQ